MGLRQFTNSLSIIRRNEHTSRPAAVMRHVLWQVRRLGSPWPIRRRISQSVLMDDEPGGVISQVNMLGLYDYNNMNFVQHLLRADSVFIDVGANIGAYTLIASEQAAVRVISLEPNPTAFSRLQRNVSLNHRSNVTILNRAASASPGMLRMTNNGADPTNRVVSGDAGTSATIEVQVDTLDAVCAAYAVQPTLIKIDVEGHEPHVLAGASACLRTVVGCIVENGDRTVVVDIMRAHGLRGPFYYRHKLGRLQREAQPLAEDAIYIGPAFESYAPATNIPV